MAGPSDTFNYLAVLFSVVVGLAATEILQGVKRLLVERQRVVPFFPPILWSMALLLILAQTWWALFGLSSQTSWTFGMYCAVLMQIVILYTVCALALPDLPQDGEVDMRTAYFLHRRPFFSLLIAAIAASLVKDIAIGGRLPEATNLAFHALFAAFATAALLSTRDWLHKLVATVVALTFIAYTVLLFSRLPS